MVEKSVSYYGDRVMGIFISNCQRNDAVSCAFEINYAIKNFIRPELNKQYKASFKIRHIAGTDTTEFRAARTSVS